MMGVILLELSVCSAALDAVSLLCESPLKHADPVPNGKLTSVSMITRHGLRSPMNRWNSPEADETWVCDSETANSPRMYVSPMNGVRRRYAKSLSKNLVPFPPNCDFGELLIQGMEQQYQLGQFIRNYLVTEAGILPQYLDKSIVTFRASRVERTVRSGVSLMNGLYPPVAPGEQISIITGTDTKEVLYPYSGSCAEMSAMWTNFVSSSEFQTRMNASVKLYQPIYQAYNFSNDGVNWMFIGDYLSNLVCANHSIPSFVTDEMVIQGVKDIAYFSYGHFGMNQKVAGSPIWRQIFSDIDDYIAQRQGSGRFRLYSAHDTTIVALLVSLGYNFDNVPPFRSHFLVETWQVGSEDLKVRFVFNGEVMPIQFMANQTLVSYSALKTAMTKGGYLSYCTKEFPVK